MNKIVLIALTAFFLGIATAMLYSHAQDRYQETENVQELEQVNTAQGEPLSDVVLEEPAQRTTVAPAAGASAPAARNGTQVLPCTAGDVEGSASLEASGGAVNGAILITARPGKTCSLSGFAQVSLKTRTGTLAITERTVGTAASSTLEPGNTAIVRVTWTNWCGKQSTSPLSFRLVLPGDSGYLEIPAIDANGRSQFAMPSCMAAGIPSALSIQPFARG